MNGHSEPDRRHLPDPWLFDSEALLRELARCRETALQIPITNPNATHFGVQLIHRQTSPFKQLHAGAARPLRSLWSRSEAFPCDESNALYCAQIARLGASPLDVWRPMPPRCSTHRIRNRQLGVADTVPSV